MISINDNLHIYFPLKYKPRQQQIDILNYTKQSINSGKKFILIDAPVGCGKSYTVLMLANFYKLFVNKDAKFDIITNSKILQQQYKKEFDFINDLRGQSNYKCVRHNTDCRTGKELNRSSKIMPCGSCPYDDAKENWINGDISLTNFHLFNSFAFYVPETIERRKSNVLIIDEAHSFESTFCDFISFKLNRRILKSHGIEEREIELYENKLRDIKTLGSFINFLSKDFLCYIIDLRQSFEDELGKITNDKIKKTYVDYIEYIKTSEEKINALLTDFDKNEYNWALDITKTKQGDIELIMQPIWGNVYLNDVIWRYYDHVIFMSGSILDKNIFSTMNGLDENITDYYRLDSVFPVKNRPIYYYKAGKMTYDKKEETFQEQIKVIEKILKKYENERGIIHTTNYEIANWIKKSIKNNRLIFHETEDREEQLEKMKKKKNGVIVSPSMTSGISLDNELSRFQIILKVPYPNISSNKIKSRQTSNRKWYVWNSVVDLAQSYGRSIRNEDDYADTYLLDSSFDDILRWNRDLLPNYFIEALKILK